VTAISIQALLADRTRNLGCQQHSHARGPESPGSNRGLTVTRHAGRLTSAIQQQGLSDQGVFDYFL
jgi:hypothetical protein